MSDESLRQSVQRSFDRDAVRDCILDLAATCEPEDPFNPADTPQPEVAVLALMDLLGNVRAKDAAESVSEKG